jgi:hypothetical protein
MALQHAENLLRRYRGQVVNIKTVSGGLYEGRVAEITNDYVALVTANDESNEQVFVLLHSIEAVLPRRAAESGGK